MESTAPAIPRSLWAAAPEGGSAIDPTDDLLQALEAAGTVFWLYDVACRQFVYVSQSLATTFGIPSADVATVHARIVAAVHPDDRAIVRASRVPVRNQPQLIEYRLVRADGSLAWVSDQSCPSSMPTAGSSVSPASSMT